MENLGIDRPTAHLEPLSDITIRVLSGPPFYFFDIKIIANDSEICALGQGEEKTVAIAAGNVTLYARLYGERSRSSTRTLYEETYFGRSEKMTVQFQPFAKYLISIDARGIHQETLTFISVAWHIFRHMLGGKPKMNISDEETWPPTIKMSLDRIYSE